MSIYVTFQRSLRKTNARGGERDYKTLDIYSPDTQTLENRQKDPTSFDSDFANYRPNNSRAQDQEARKREIDNVNSRDYKDSRNDDKLDHRDESNKPSEYPCSNMTSTDQNILKIYSFDFTESYVCR